MKESALEKGFPPPCQGALFLSEDRHFFFPFPVKVELGGLPYLAKFFERAPFSPSPFFSWRGFSGEIEGDTPSLFCSKFLRPTSLDPPLDAFGTFLSLEAHE